MTESMPANTWSSTGNQLNDSTPSVPWQAAPALARAYVVTQQMGSVYNLCDALKAGTLFPELYRPYS
ncbi:MAG: spore coat associated protein CotJA [Peptococcaceae bacterium]|nr:spore coat associated protein CotJA [Peptococcaceae bacterium]